MIFKFHLGLQLQLQ